VSTDRQRLADPARQKDGQIVAVRPQPPLAPSFTAIRDVQEVRLGELASFQPLVCRVILYPSGSANVKVRPNGPSNGSVTIG
jgi:hypothetical protein